MTLAGSCHGPGEPGVITCLPDVPLSSLALLDHTAPETRPPRSLIQKRLFGERTTVSRPRGILASPTVSESERHNLRNVISVTCVQPGIVMSSENNDFFSLPTVIHIFLLSYHYFDPKKERGKIPS